jgi:hypothetical protein
MKENSPVVSTEIQLKQLLNMSWTLFRRFFQWVKVQMWICDFFFFFFILKKKKSNQSDTYGCYTDPEESFLGGILFGDLISKNMSNLLRETSYYVIREIAA